MKDTPEEVQKLLKTVFDHYDNEDRAVRERQIRQWKKLKYYWAGFQRLWWSEVAHDWRVWDQQILNDQTSGDQAFYDKPINVFRAYLESIVAALSVTVPPINCYPDDADNPLDISTAKAGDKIAELVYKHNDAPLLWIHALFIYCTEGMIAAYSYPKEDEAYGTYEEPQYANEEVEQTQKVCPNCGNQFPEDPSLVSLEDQIRNEYMPDEEDVPVHDLLNENQTICSQCLMQVDPQLKTEKVIIEKLTGVTQKPKTRQCIEVYGGLFVKVPNYAMKQADIPYLIFSYDTDKACAIERYEHLHGKLDDHEKNKIKAGGLYDPYERWGRLSTQYYGEYPINTVTVRNAWLRPAAFNVLSNSDDVKKLKKLYPDGVKVVFINEQFAEACNESLDDCWTLTYNPLSDYIHFDPLGLLLTSVQEISNDLVSLTLQTIEHGIPQTFADPSVLNFDEYRQTEVSPGAIYPARPSSGHSLGEAFYEVKTATLSGEVLPFAEKVQELGQLVSGALPSLFGGAAPNSSKTAAQYSMSRQQALQRQGIAWKMLIYWWKNIFAKVIPSYMKDVVEDEKYVQKNTTGNFVNVFIRKAELQGKIGSIELEANETLPMNWSQVKEVILQLMQSNNPEVMSALASPENLPILRQAIGLDDFSLPGEEDRQKQYEEIRLLMDSEPIQMPDPMTGQPIERPSVEVDPILDNHAIEAEVCRFYLIGEAGRLAKTENPGGYKNVLLHMKEHMMIQQQNMMMQQQAQASQGPQQSNKQEEKTKPMMAKPNASSQAQMVQ